MKPDNVLTKSYLARHPENTARVLESLPPQMTAEFFMQLSPEEYIDTFESLLPSYGAGLIKSLPETTRNELAGALSAEKLSLLFSFFDEKERHDFLSRITPEKRRKVLSRLQYPDDTVGSIMQPPFFSLPQDINAADAVKRIKTAKSYDFSEIVVIDRAFHYIGMIPLDKLIKAPPHRKLRLLADKDIIALSARKSLKKLTDHPAWSSYRLLPVTDVQGVLIGILDYASLLQHNITELPRPLEKQAQSSSAMELLFQSLAVPIEALAVKMFPFDQTNTARNRKHGNGV